jgi:hypothetical protein
VSDAAAPILTPDQRLRDFISSTLGELGPADAEAARFAGRRMSAAEALALVRPSRYDAATSTAALTP